MESYKLLRPQAAAAMLGLSHSTLAKMRLRGDGPPYSKAGARAVLYSVDDIVEWLESRKRLSTSEPSK